MCGIAGIIQRKPVYGIQHVQKMTHALAHRGPDGEGYWQNAGTTSLLGHRRLAILDLSDAAAQPLHYTPPASLQSRYSIVYNGEIYNYIELKQELAKKGYRFHTTSDTEVIVAAYDYWDADCLTRFDGMFAFAIWDEQEKELFAGRDRFGEKPFYYTFDKNCLMFASEMKALWAAGVNKTPNLKMLFNFITIGYVDNPERPEETFFENVFQLPASSCLFFDQATGELQIEDYWKLSANPQRNTNETEMIARLGELLKASVNRRLRSDVPVGTSLSGGLDSSTITALITQANNASFSYQCFTASFPGFEKDEIHYSKLIAEQFQLQQHITNVDASALVTDWSRFCRQQEEPVSSASAFAQYKVFELVREHNVSVLLDGQGADEILAGYHKYYKWYWQELFQKRKLIRSKEIGLARSIGVQERFGIRNAMASILPDLASVILEKQYLFHALAQEDLDREFVRLQSKEAYYSTPELNGLNGVLLFNTSIHGLGELLRYADRNSMAHGREVRLPFLDHQLVEFLFTLPSNYKIRNGWTKWMLRKLMNDQLPEEIIWRRDKTGFEPPQKQWMQHKPLQDMIISAREVLVKEKVLQPRVLDKTPRPSEAYDKENYDWRYLSAASSLFNLL